MFTKLLIAASALLLVAYGMEPDNYDGQRRNPVQHAAAVPVGSLANVIG